MKSPSQAECNSYLLANDEHKGYKCKCTNYILIIFSTDNDLLDSVFDDNVMEIDSMGKQGIKTLTYLNLE